MATCAYTKLIAKKILNLRLSLNMSVKQFAYHCDVHRSTIYALERGKNEPTPKMLAKICHKTGTNYQEFMLEICPLIMAEVEREEGK